MVAVREFDDGHHVVMGTRQGTIKKTELSAFANPRAGGIIAMGIDEGDEVIAVQISDGQSQIFIGTRDGMAIRFPEDDVRPMGRTAYGVRGISLREGDEVVAMEVVKPGGTPADGHRARLRQADRRSTSTGCRAAAASALKNVEITEKNGKVISIAQVDGDERELLIITEQGKILRTPTEDIRTIGRATQGVRLMDLDDGDRLVSVALVDQDEDAPACRDAGGAACRSRQWRTERIAAVEASGAQSRRTRWRAIDVERCWS